MNTAPKPLSIRLEVADDGQVLRLINGDESSRFHALWLRDNGQDEATRDPTNGQKRITLQDIPQDTTITTARIDGASLCLSFAPDDKQTYIDLDWLWARRYDKTRDFSLISPDLTTWEHHLMGNIPNADYATCRSDPARLLAWLQGVARYGVAIMDDIPAHDGAVLEVIKLFGFVRATNYGPYFEIRSEIAPVNLAYTRLGLQAHTDNPYRDPVPGLQLFGCIENDAEGGESVVVDGFRIAELLCAESAEYFDLLSVYNACFEYAGSHDTCLRADKPMIELGPDGTLTAIRFNNRSCAALTQIPYSDMAAYYRAYRRFGELVNDPALQVTFKLKPRQLFITDNTRVLHGRAGFAGAGNRWMQGAYADRDSLYSRIRVLTQVLENG